MLKFFRRIRQKLLTKNPPTQSSRAGRYLLYALGEIALVMIGILLALQVNNWNQNRIDRRSEIKYLKNLQKDLKQDTLRINRLVFKRFDKKMEGLQLAKDYALYSKILEQLEQGQKARHALLKSKMIDASCQAG